MSQSPKRFHEFALKSILFKGRGDWYFCFLKAERIAHVLTLLSEKGDARLCELAEQAGELPGTVAHFVAGEVDAQVVLADIMALLVGVRLGTTAGLIAKDTSVILCNEYEILAERFAASMHVSPFATVEDFAVPEFPLEIEPPRLVAGIPGFGAAPAVKDIKDTKGHISQGAGKEGQEPSVRSFQILDFVRKNKGVSIKDVAGVVRGCSEKTLQRELALLIERGLIKKVGERRWSQYWAA